MKEKKYETLYCELRDSIVAGVYPVASRLPSKRVLADRTGVSRMTVEHVYALLEEEGYLESRERRGYFVLPMPELPRATEAGIPHLSEPHACAAMPAQWVRTVRKVLSERGGELFCKAPGRGCEVLRNAIADYLLRYRGMVADPRRIVIGSGAEQLYDVVFRLLGRGRIYGIEDPGYAHIRAVYEGAGATICPLPMGKDGIKSAALRGGGFDVLHVTPFRSYPSAVSASPQKRLEYLAWAKEPGHFLVEDDYASEFFHAGRPAQTLYKLSGGQAVIYLNTFSQSLSPSMRIGYMILPASLDAVYDRVLGSFSCPVPVMDQYFLAEFLTSGNFERHLNRMRRKMTRE